jgi:PAS domain S-box-containing protein
MSNTAELSSQSSNEELRALYDGSTEGILIADVREMRFLRANRIICRMLGYTNEEMLSLSIPDIHPADNLSHALEAFKAMSQRRLKVARNIPCMKKNGDIIFADITTARLTFQNKPCLLGFFRDITEQKRSIELLRASDERYRMIADNVADVIWIVDFAPPDFKGGAAGANIESMVDEMLEQWRFSYISPSAGRLFGYTSEEIKGLPLKQISTPATLLHVRKAMIEEITWLISHPHDAVRQRTHELEYLAKDGSTLWCEVVSRYLRNLSGFPVGLLGITRDVTKRRQAENALRKSEATLRSLFENLPDFVLLMDRNSNIQFANRDFSDISRDSLRNKLGLDLAAPEHRDISLNAVKNAFDTGLPQNFEAQDIFGRWWSVRLVPLPGENNAELVMAICTDINEARLATEAVRKEQRLLRKLLDLHERERQLIAYEIHDGFAQQLTGALFRLQAFRDVFAKDPAEAWCSIDSTTVILSKAINEARRLISGLRPPILDELGIVEAVQYLIYENQDSGGPEIDFDHELASARLATPMENAIFRIVQESLQNACRHSHSDRIHISLVQRNNCMHIDVRDWGVGFDPNAVEEHRFGLQGIRERVRLLDGRVSIESTANQGTHISVELPLVDSVADASEDG